MRGKTPWKLAVAATAIALFAAGCSSGDDGGGQSTDNKGGELRYNSGNPESLLPPNDGESEGIAVIRAVYQGLVDFDPQSGAVVNAIAEDISSTDNKVWTIKIKSGYKFDNGEPVNADAFIRSWNYAAYGPNAMGNSYFFAPIVGYNDMQSTDPDGDGPKTAPDPKAKELSGLKKIDDNTLEVSLTDPFAGWPVVLGYSAFVPLAEACIADTKACNLKPIGNGPFKMDGQWEDKVQIKLVRNDDFAGTKANIDRLTFKIYDNQDTAYADFQAGELDITDFVPPAKLPEARTTYGDRLTETATSSLTYVGFPLYNNNFKDKRIRQALSLAVDRQAIIDAVFQGSRTPAGSLAPDLILGSRPEACKYCKFDPAQAKALLAEAGGWKGGKLTFWFNAGAGHDSWVQAVADSIKTTLGIDYQLKGNLQFPEYLATGDEKKFTGPFRLGWSADYPLLENYLTPLFGKGGSSNYPDYDNPAFDAKVAEGNNAKSVDEAVAFYQQAEDMVLEDMPIIPMWWGRTAIVRGDTVKSITYNKINDLDFATAVMNK